MNHRQFTLSLFLALGVSFNSQAGVPKVQATGVFSNFHYVQEAGDVVGMEIHVLYGNQYWVLFQLAEGAPSAPVLVEAKVMDGSIEFSLPESFGILRTFRGKISKSGITGKFAGQSDTIRLPRTKSYWQ